MIKRGEEIEGELTVHIVEGQLAVIDIVISGVKVWDATTHLAPAIKESVETDKRAQKNEPMIRNVVRQFLDLGTVGTSSLL
jgi:hypothetical protein